ncbi:catechol 2,3-dioxygenase-like lactoylglutathione lyase family enzyme [Herbaspirillum sp. Sphag1AN]|uniref:VOC family protein n=1 Tax=unclassified Herbaspirillum TaxID=2624150 RepID=UPI0016079910|nr:MULTISPECIES: VOC family protein [unclassified Herbaspirillum]MBB3211693.1 catechol 2,3-dioxygenase-like lactoylglutathione lyase family enzyme [Herbaspirillum sp. Sphag1AN]MBB3245039.1 catechol 2,3-dioxygenase-like lactoylglutathione lyase family enzyme [Herbaspirillum sp. Sphag64]
MNIIGPDALVFGVDDLAASIQYLIDYGLQQVSPQRFEALDGTAVILARHDDLTLPPAMPTASKLRKTVYGVADQASLDAIAAEIGRDRAVRRLADGAIEAEDNAGFMLGFQITCRRPLALAAESVNAPGAPAQRGINQLGVNPDAIPRPRSLSHVVYFVPDAAHAEAFYTRLGFVCTDRFTGVGPFLRPAGTQDHHTLFLIQTPPVMKGCEHFTFHMGGPTEVMQAGTNMVNKGYQSFWGPGRHRFGSNWFWYFNSPLGCHVEYDADMDLHDTQWVAREAGMSADASQLFLFQQRDKWAPGGPPPKSAAVSPDELAVHVK